MLKPVLASALLVFSLLTASPATFSVNPSVVTNDYRGLVTLQMSGLAFGESVQVVQFYDFNGNGVVDPQDMPVRADLITDGQAILVGGSTNFNVLGDDDGFPDGSVTSTIRFTQSPTLASGVGHYLFQFSSPSNQFPTVTLPFTVADAPYLQKVQGFVTSSGTNVPHAAVALIQNLNGLLRVVVGTVADDAGAYALPAPSDAYTLIASWPGYLMDLTAAPVFALLPGTTVVTNLGLIPATTALSGGLVDSESSQPLPMPAVQLMLFDATGLFTVGLTDAQGSFRVPVTPGYWTVRPEWQSVVAHSYLIPEPASYMEKSFFVSVVPYQGAEVPLKAATTLLTGRVVDSQSNSIPGVVLSASPDANFDGLAMSGSDGTYAIALDSGSGFANVQDLSSPPASAYLWSGDYVNMTDGIPTLLDVVGQIPTAHFRGLLTDDFGAPLRQFYFFANNAVGGTSTTITDTNGNFDLPVFGGSWQLHPGYGEEQQLGLLFPPFSFRVVDGQDLSTNLVVRRASGLITGFVGDTAAGLSGLSVACSANDGSTPYSLTSYTDSTGHFSVRVFPATWTLSLGEYDLLSRGYNPASTLAVTVPPTNAVANFALVPIGPPTAPPHIVTPTLSSAVLGLPYSQALAATGAQTPFSWSVISGVLPGNLHLDYYGVISGVPTNTGAFSFAVKLADARGSNVVANFSIDVSAATLPVAPAIDQPTLRAGVFTLRVTGTAGQSYTLQAASPTLRWSDLTTLTAPSNVFFMQDTNPAMLSRLFRVRAN